MAHPSADLLRNVQLFSDLDDATLERLAGDFIQRDFPTGTAIAVEGQDGLNFFVIESGEATVTVGGNLVATIGPGHAFGEIALVDKSARSATITATTDVKAYALPVWSFRSFVETRPDVAWRLLEILAERLRVAQQPR
jgi:CRP-like cAMP-binding protein